MALGAGRGVIAGQFFVESALFSLAASALGLVLAWISLRSVVLFFGDRLPRADEISMDATAFLLAVSLGLLCSLIVGCYPAWRVSRSDMQGDLRAGT